MSVKSVGVRSLEGGLANLNQTEIGKKTPTSGVEFKGTLDQIASQMDGQLGSGSVRGTQAPRGLDKALALKFSSHAVDRMRSRGISFSPEMMNNIEGAVQKAAQKGSKDTLVLAGESALIVSVKNNTVVTVMDRAAMKDNVFTNIDSTVVI